MEKFSSGLSCQGRKECAKVIVQRILAAGGPGTELVAGHAIGIVPWLCKVATGHGSPGCSERLALSWHSPLQETATVRC